MCVLSKLLTNPEYTFVFRLSATEILHYLVVDQGHQHVFSPISGGVKRICVRFYMWENYRTVCVVGGCCTLSTRASAPYQHFMVTLCKLETCFGSTIPHDAACEQLCIKMIAAALTTQYEVWAIILLSILAFVSIVYTFKAYVHSKMCLACLPFVCTEMSGLNLNY